MISQKELTGGLSLEAFGLNEAIKGWARIEGSDGFLPAYKVTSIAGSSKAIGELVHTNHWTPVTQAGKTYGWLLASDPEETIAAITVSDLAVALVEEAQEEPDEDEDLTEDEPRTTEDLQQIIDEAPDFDLLPASELTNEWSKGKFSNAEINDSFDEFMDQFPSKVPDTDAMFDAFEAAVKSTKSLKRINVAAAEYDGDTPALLWLSGEMYLEQSVFQHSR